MDTMPRRRLLRLLALGPLGLAACNARHRPDSRRQTWTVLVDLSGTAVTDRQYYAKELDLFIQGIAEIKPAAVVDVVGFSTFAKPLVSGQAQLLPSQLPAVIDAIRKWPLDPRTDFSAAFSVAHDLQRKRDVERRAIWMLGDGVQDPSNRWRSRPTFAVPLPSDLPVDAMRASNTVVHWDALDEYQLAGWQRLFEDAAIPATLHLRGYVETARARLQRLPKPSEGHDVDDRASPGLGKRVAQTPW